MPSPYCPFMSSQRSKEAKNKKNAWSQVRGQVDISITSVDVYVIFIEVVNNMAPKCKMNSAENTDPCIGQIFQPYHFKMVSEVSALAENVKKMSVKYV